MSSAPDVLVIGGGIIGLAIAWQVGRAGASVRVLERDRVGSHASGAAAGMLAPLAEAENPGPCLELGLSSLEAYPTFLEQLRFDSDVEVMLEGPGLLRLAFSGAEADRMRGLLQSRAAQKLGARWLGDAELSELQPGVSSKAIGAVLSPLERHLDPRKVMHALRRACESQRISFVEGVRAEAAGRAIPKGAQVVYAAGAWTGEVLSRVGVRLPVRPVKGQVLMMRQHVIELHYTVFGGGGYLVPRVDGSLVVGATSEEAGFDERVTPAAEAELLDKAQRLYPAASGFERVDAWASLRPATPDGMPIMGQVCGQDDSYVATGHYRNGILLAPITARLMAQSILTGHTPAMLDPFSPQRFLQGSAK